MEDLGVMFSGAYRDRRVLLTGVTGFKGSWLAYWARRLGAKVCGIALPPHTQPNLFDQVGLGEWIDYREVDVRDAAHVARMVEDWHPDLIFHLAAQTIVRTSYDDPVGTFATNVLGTVAVLDAAQRIGCPVVAVTSDKCYEPHDPLSEKETYREEDPLGGCDPYSASKGCAELTAAAYRRSYGLAVATARAGNVVGPGDWAKDRIVPDAVRALSAGTPIVVRNPSAVRPFQHVLEPLAGYLLLGQCLPGLAEAWNFGPGDKGERDVRELIETFIAAWGTGIWVHEPCEDKKPEAAVLALCVDKAASRLGLRPVWTFSEAIYHTAEGYRALLAAADARAARKVLDGEIEAYTLAAHARGIPWTV